MKRGNRSADPSSFGFLGTLFPPLAVFILIVAILQMWLRLRHVPRYILPLPSEVGRTLWADHPELLSAFWTTAQASLIGLGASSILGILAGILLSTSSLLRRAFYPYALFFQTVPIIAVAPLLVIWFDPGLTSVSISAFICSVFPVIANTLAGLLSTDPALLDLFRLYHANPLQRLLKLRLPSALPSIFTGLRVAAGLAVIGAVVGEFLVGTLVDNEGLGVKIVSATKTGRTDRVFAAVLMASLLGLILFSMINLAGYLLLRRWHVSEQQK